MKQTLYSANAPGGVALSLRDDEDHGLSILVGSDGWVFVGPGEFGKFTIHESEWSNWEFA